VLEPPPEPALTGGHPLDNAVWSSLTTGHASLAQVAGRARRYPATVSPFAAVDGFDEGSWSDLAELVGPTCTFALSGGDLPAAPPPGWSQKLRGRGRQMTVAGDRLADTEPIALRRLTTDDVPQMLHLVTTTDPGPFLPGTIEMGRYYGHFAGDRLMAMAGERLHLDGYTEISAVCTDPARQGRGLASALTHHVASGIFERGEHPFLHVAASNERALRVYERLGFSQRRIIEFALVRSPPA